MRNLLATLLLSQGVPMLLGGDEFGRTQGGNNNAYCQDSEISWLDWEGMGDEGKALLSFTRKLILLRRAHIVFHRHRFFLGQIVPGTEVKDIVWLRPDGAEMSTTDWENAFSKALAVRLSGEPGLMHLTERGEQEPDDTFLILLNASHESVTFRIPEDPAAANWEAALDTAAETDAETPQTHAAGGETSVEANSLRLLVLLNQVVG
jgi:glycogen operon protein